MSRLIVFCSALSSGLFFVLCFCRQIIGVDEASLKWTVAREVLTCYEAHGVPLPPGVS